MSHPPDAQSPSEPEPPPTLDPATVEDDQALGEVVDQFLFMDVEARERLGEIGRYTEALRSALDPCAWQLLLRIDELSTARWADLVVAVARWAFLEGQRHPVSLEEASS